jgi:flavin-dependent dehydrogenase
VSDHDVVVVGAGPGGCAAALGLARAGLRVALLDRDRFPRDKVCGDAITPLGVKLLAQLGLLDDIRAIADAETRGIRVAIGRAPANELSTPLLVVRRTVLDAALVDAVRPLVDVVEQVAVTELVLAGDAVCGVIARDAQGKSVTLRASVVIGADGATSTVARLAGAQTNLREHRLLASRAYFSGVRLDDDEPEFHFLPELGGGYLWIFPAGPDRYNVGLGATTEHLTHAARTPKAWRASPRSGAARFRAAGSSKRCPARATC